MENGRGVNPERLVLLGPPAAGKGTQAELLSRELHIPQVSTGAVIREEISTGSELGRAAAREIEQGRLLSDETVCAIVESWLEQAGHASGFIFDGFPRTVPQAAELDDFLDRNGHSLDLVIFIDVPRSVIEERIHGRLQCDTCGTIFSGPRDGLSEDGACPRDDGRLVRRKDDRIEILEERMREYEGKTRPLVGYYEGKGLLHRVDGTPSPGEVFSSIMESFAVPAP